MSRTCERVPVVRLKELFQDHVHKAGQMLPLARFSDRFGLYKAVETRILASQGIQIVT
jgi:hypothetical protein